MEQERSISKELVAKQLEPGIYRDDMDFWFCLKVTPSGRKVFQVRKRVKGETEKTTVTIGIYGEITATVARGRAQKIIQQMAAGINPNEVEKRGKPKRRNARSYWRSRRKRLLWAEH